MPLVTERWNREDIFIDYALEYVMFRWDHEHQRALRRWYGDSFEQADPAESGLFHESLTWGDEISREQYDSSARQFAARVHGSQKYGRRPYLFHLDSVGSLAREYHMPAHVEAAAYLHDALEDCPKLTEAELRSAFGATTTQLVVALTKTKGATVETYFQQLRAMGPDAVFLKLADRLCNLSGCPGEPLPPKLLAKYQGQQPLLRSILYRKGEHDGLWGRLEGFLKRIGSTA